LANNETFKSLLSSTTEKPKETSSNGQVNVENDTQKMSSSPPNGTVKRPKSSSKTNGHIVDAAETNKNDINGEFSIDESSYRSVQTDR